MNADKMMMEKFRNFITFIDTFPNETHKDLVEKAKRASPAMVRAFIKSELIDKDPELLFDTIATEVDDPTYEKLKRYSACFIELYSL